jgi:hypothetical protein
MPLAVARKLEWFIRENDLDYDVQLRPVILTHDQCIEYELPRAPNAAGDTRAARFEARFGEGRTELDALEALHPGELRNILRAEIDRYLGRVFRRDWEAAKWKAWSELDAASDTVRENFAEELAPFEARFQQLHANLAALLADVQPLYDRIRAALREEGNAIPDDADFPEPPEADEDPDPLYDSSRDYVEQIDRYKGHQGKTIKRKVAKNTSFIDTPSGRMTIKDAARAYGVSLETIKGRLRRNKPFDDLFVDKK